ncbi:MAG TPA: hypothetical protein VFI47_22070 [Acidimicrobiales bacterium]|nr:hypothetical protein [Acidimicrobiales bacterium]
MSANMAWYAARSAGIVAWLLVTASVVWGLFVSTRVLGGRPTPKWLLDLHRFLGGLAVTFTAVHLAGLVADNYVHFGAADLLVPFATGWKPAAVALGIVAFWLLAAVELTSLLMRRLPRRLWRAVHMSSYGLFWFATVHGIWAGTDTGNSIYTGAVSVAVTLVVFLTIVRMLAGRPTRQVRPSPRRRTADAEPTGGDPTERIPTRPSPRPGPTGGDPTERIGTRPSARARPTGGDSTQRIPTRPNPRPTGGDPTERIPTRPSPRPGPRARPPAADPARRPAAVPGGAWSDATAARHPRAVTRPARPGR